AGGADRHRLARAGARGQSYQPIALDPRFFGIAAEMGLAPAPAVDDDLFARPPLRMRGRLRSPRETHAGKPWKAANDRRLPGDCKPVLVVHRRPFDPNSDVSLHQMGFVEIGEADLLPAVTLLDHDCLECRHASSWHSPSYEREALPRAAGRR